MQDEILAANPASKIRIVGVNGVGYESANHLMTADRDLPWLQDTDSMQVWGSWAAGYRDVIILDEANVRAAVFNLTEHNLTVQEQYDALLALLRAQAGE